MLTNLFKTAFKAETSSAESELEHSILVSSTYKIGSDDLLIMYGKSLRYKRKIRGPSTEPWGTPCLTFCHSETPLA
jgi:hypothetical protein